MSFYPMNFERLTLNHKGGTKSYHMLIICNGEDTCVLVKRWGKTGTFGQFKVERYTTSEAAEREFEKTMREKRSGGYAPDSTFEDSADRVIRDESDLRRCIGRVMVATFGADNLLHIDPGFDVSGIKSGPKSNGFDDEGRPVSQNRMSAHDLENLARQQEAVAREKEVEQMKSIPGWGMF